MVVGGWLLIGDDGWIIRGGDINDGVSESDVVLSLLCSLEDAAGHFIQPLVLLVQRVILQLQILEFLVLSSAVVIEHLGQVVHAITDELIQLLELGLGRLL